MNNQEKIVSAFKNALNVEEDLIIDTLEYQSIPEWDSVSHMILISEIEEVFDIALDTDDVIDLSSVSKAKEILTKYNIIF